MQAQDVRENHDADVSDQLMTVTQPTTKTKEREPVFLKRIAAIEAYDAEMEELELLKYSNEHTESIHGRLRKSRREWSPTLHRVRPAFSLDDLSGDSEESN